MKNRLLVVLLLLAFATPVSADNCDIAWQMAKQATETFKKDPQAGLKLLIKAQGICTTDAGLNYNLGMAYASYGRPADAVPFLDNAVKGSKAPASWQNNLAAVLLMAGGDSDRALSIVKKAVAKDANNPEFQLTLIEAISAKGDLLGALRLANTQQQRFAQKKEFSEWRGRLLNQVMAAALEQVQQGDVDVGLAALQKIDFAGEAALAHAQVLQRLNRFEPALKSAAAGKKQHPAQKDEFVKVEQTIFSAMTRTYYQQFQSGATVQAYGAAKDLLVQYPTNEVVKKTERDLWNALIADATTIEVPKAQQLAAPVGGSSYTQSADLLAGIGTKASVSTDATQMDLTVDVDSQIPKGHLKRPNSVAVIIGNQNYARYGNGIGDVKYAGRDAAVMKKYLVETMGFDPQGIIFKSDATSGNLRNIFGTRENPRGKLHNYVRDGESDVFIYYVGHGAPGPDGKSAYLVPVDVQADYIANNGYPLDQFYRMLETLPAKSITVVLDACFSGDSPAGSLFDNISPTMLKNIEPVREVANTVIFSSADKDQVSTWYPAKRHSMFTYWFLKGLGGAADNDGNQSVTASEMKHYLGKEVKYWAQRESNRVQTPLMLGSGSTVLARLK